MNVWFYIISAGIIIAGIGLAIIFYLKSFRESRHLKHYEDMRDALVLRNLKLQQVKEGEAISDHDEHSEHIKHYEEIRDKLTTREIAETEIEVETGIPWIHIIGSFIAILIGVSLLGPISQATNSAVMNISSTSEAAAVILKTVPAFFAFAILAIGLAVVWGALRSGGLV